MILKVKNTLKNLIALLQKNANIKENLTSFSIRCECDGTYMIIWDN